MIRRLSFLLLVAGLLGGASLETPEQFAGFRVGADKKLVRWDRLVEYMQKAAAASPRVKFEEYGKTTNGNPFIVVTISSPETLGDLPRCRENQRRLAYPYNLTETEAQQLINQQKAVLLITCNIHSTQMIN